MEDPEPRLTMAPRVTPLPADEADTGRGSWARMAMVASRVTRNMPVVFTSRNRWYSANDRLAISTPS